MTLRVKLEIVPFGDETKTREIGRLDIFNMGYGGPGPECEYGVMDLSPGRAGLFTETVIHSRPEGAWQLLRKVLKHLRVDGP